MVDSRLRKRGLQAGDKLDEAARAEAAAVIEAGEGEVILPDYAPDIEREDGTDDIADSDGKISGARWRTKTRLQTPGQIKAEIGKLYRKATSGQIPSGRAVRLVRVLLGALKAAELELEFNLRQENPNDDRPAFAGLALIGPTPVPGNAAAPDAGGTQDAAATTIRRKSSNG